MNGPPENRIDVVFMGDGYTLDQRDAFVQDITRLTNDMWSSTTFAAVLPLFNIWAVFKPSKESGIGVGGTPKDTSFGLYRDGTELRGIYTSKPKAARAACKLTGPFACDYPSLIANDDFYGGLGGEFVIATRSKTSGTVVLRHEMGHNFVDVGEEYDGGEVYAGPNAAPALDDLPWKRWLSEPNHLVEQQGVTVVQDYAWYDLSKGFYVISFESKGIFDRWMLKISASGFNKPNTFRVTLDNIELDWSSPLHFDRTFYEWRSDVGLSKGWHELKFEELEPAGLGEPIHQLCSVDMHEYANEPLYHTDNEYIGAFPTFDSSGRKTYRPTNEGCLMRNMSRHEFCSVCKEGLWVNLMKRISFIDKVYQKCDGKSVSIELGLIGLAQFRQKSFDGLAESYRIEWFRQGERIYALDNQYNITVDAAAGEYWRVHVHLESTQIRLDKGLWSEKRFVTCLE